MKLGKAFVIAASAAAAVGAAVYAKRKLEQSEIPLKKKVSEDEWKSADEYKHGELVRSKITEERQTAVISEKIAQASQEAEKPEPEKPVQPEKEPPTEQPTEEVKPKTAYDYEFDIEAIRSDLISLGCSMGLTHITTDDGMKITPDNASWATPVTASECFQGERLKRKLTDYVQSMPDIITAYGGAPIEYFTIYIEPLGSGSYRIYFLY